MDTTAIASATSTPPATRKRRSTSKLKTPTIASSSSATRSVMRSAITIGAVRAIGMRCDSRSRNALTASPSLPGVTVSAKPARKTIPLSAAGTEMPSTRR